MSGNIWRRGRLGALTGVCAAAMLAAAGATAGAAMAQPQAAAQPQAPALAQAKVPWSSVGSGWELVQYAAGAPSKDATTLYLVSPSGTKYSMYTWRAAKTTNPPSLVAWSGDKTRALFFDDVDNKVTQLTLTTGKTSSFTLTGQTSPLGYTLPDGLNIVAVTNNSSSFTLARYSLTGKLQKVLVRSSWAYEAAYAPNGVTLAIPGSKGLQLVSNAGGVIRQLSVPGTAPSVGCAPVRWWSSSTILADCDAKGSGEPRLWLVPASGAKATALTPQRSAKGPDLGDIDGWRLSSGLYLQSLGACGTLEINKQAANGSVTEVKVPGTPNTKDVILSADGPRLLIDPQDACLAGGGLLWFNPGTHAEQWLFHYSPSAFFEGVIPFNSIENAPAI
jgi:hypothetical protein